MREIRRRTRVVGAFPDGHSALMLCAARLRHVAGTRWGLRKYLNMDLFREQDVDKAPERGGHINQLERALAILSDPIEFNILGSNIDVTILWSVFLHVQL
jgi:hypothetical protein